MILTDSGFWIALGNRRDPLHSVAQSILWDWRQEEFVTTWPVITEVSHILHKRAGMHSVFAFIDHVGAGSCFIAEPPDEAMERMVRLMRRYRDLPMDLADASLVVLAEEFGEGRILSTDWRDFDVYRWSGTRPFINLLPKI